MKSLSQLPDEVRNEIARLRHSSFMAVLVSLVMVFILFFTHIISVYTPVSVSFIAIASINISIWATIVVINSLRIKFLKKYG